MLVWGRLVDRVAAMLGSLSLNISRSLEPRLSWCEQVDPDRQWKFRPREKDRDRQHPGPIEHPGRPKRVHLEYDIDDDDRAQQGPARVSGTGIIEDLQQRVVKLEELLAVRPTAGQFGPIRDAPIQDSWPQPGSTATTSSVLGTLVVKGSRSRYHGQNNRITLLNQFPNAKAFINQCSTDSALVGLAKEVQFLQAKTQEVINSPNSMSGIGTFAELENLLNRLPPKTACDRLLDVYIKNLEKTFRIIHVPSFVRRHGIFWQSTDHKLFCIAPLLTAILAVAVCLEPDPFSPELLSSWDYLKNDAIELLQIWLNNLPRKYRVDLESLQVETLIVLSRQLRLESPEELWKASGSLVRSAIVMGLHVNLSHNTSLSVFQAECRRRLWITIVEMDLQVSIAAGMPVMTPALDFGPLTPANLDDGMFDESTLELPPPMPLEEETSASSQIILATSLSRRIRIMGTVQHTTSQDNLEERLRQGQELEDCLKSIPSPLRLDHYMASAKPATALHNVLLDVFLRRPLLCLYRPVVTNSDHENASLHEIRHSCLESSIAILSYQDYFDPNTTDLEVNSNVYWNVFHTFCQQDILWAALIVCEHIRSYSQQTTAPSPENNPLETSLYSQLPSKASLTRLVENTLDSLTRRMQEKGSNVKDILLLAVVLQSVRARGSAEQREDLMFQGAKKTLSACRQHLLSTVPESSLKAQMTGLARMYNTADAASLIDNELPPISTPLMAQLPDITPQPSELASEFYNFESDLFSFDDGSFMWNM
ncbi:hypothetical protein N7462_007035 [Penicillium macrosclerotiorum]|uniref:uncharacterized protein n=1 Tax=Penicillium macrosclerotiorum TaxID=303699 RepID=UPI002548BFF7|nr:uncharacterized protein N7462_007035 [Penicillium macrosclerotiorum]KAJ5678791.1 hypothetical protein N7462_007035 [Penicillium macrosclerotiorum]